MVRTPRSLVALAAAVALALLTSITALPSAAARCRPSPGDELVLLTPAPEAGVLLFLRRASYRRADPLLDGPAPTSLSVRRTDTCTRGCTARLTLEPLASNLFRADVASLRRGAWTVTTPAASGAFSVPASSSSASPSSRPPSSTPSPTPAPSPLPAPRFGPTAEGVLGTMARAPLLTLTAAAPSGAVGLLARWPGGTFFMVPSDARTSFLLSPGRCRRDLPGFTPPSVGAVLEVAFVDAAGRLSPTTRVTLP